MKSNFGRIRWEHIMVLVSALTLLASSARAGFHLWEISEVYSSADGSVQFVEFKTTSGSQEFLSGQNMVCFGPQGSNVFRFPFHLASINSANRTFIVGTSNLLLQPGSVRPDFIFTNATPFLFRTPGFTNTVRLNGAATAAAVYTNLPTDGRRSLARTGTGTAFATIVTNSPKNYSNFFNSIVPAQISTAGLAGNNFVISFPTATGTNDTAGPNYAIEGSGTLNPPAWTVVSNVTGNGATKTVALPIDPTTNQVFRLRVP